MATEPATACASEGKSASGLLSLPCELREIIYECAVVASGDFIELPNVLRARDSHCLPDHGAMQCVKNYTALSATCHQTYDEVTPCFFANNQFGTWSGYAGHDDAAAGVDHALKYIKHLALYRFDMKEFAFFSEPVCSLNLTLTGSSVEYKVKGAVAQAVTLGQGVKDAAGAEAQAMAEVVGAMYQGERSFESASESTQKSAKQRIEGVITQLRQDLQEEHGLTRSASVALARGISNAW